MMLSDILDYIESLDIAEYVYMGKLDPIKSVSGELISHGWNLIGNAIIGDIILSTGQEENAGKSRITPFIPVDFSKYDEYELKMEKLTSFIYAWAYNRNKEPIARSPAAEIPSRKYNKNSFVIDKTDVTDKEIKYIRVKFGLIKNSPVTIDDMMMEKIRLTSTEDSNKPYDRYRGSSISLPELRAITDTDGNIIAEDVLYIDRKARHIP